MYTHIYIHYKYTYNNIFKKKHQTRLTVLLCGLDEGQRGLALVGGRGLGVGRQAVVVVLDVGV